jgi:two-component system nitrate/nitrite response regulator NarL
MDDTERANPDAQTLRTVTVVLVDDHQLFRTGMARAIAAHPGLQLVAQTSNGIDALSAIEELEPDVALVDLRMPGIDGFEVCDRVTAHWPPLRTRVLLATAYPDEFSVGQSEALGAAGFVGKECSREQICAALLEAERTPI